MSVTVTDGLVVQLFFNINAIWRQGLEMYILGARVHTAVSYCGTKSNWITAFGSNVKVLQFGSVVPNPLDVAGSFSWDDSYTNHLN